MPGNSWRPRRKGISACDWFRIVMRHLNFFLLLLSVNDYETVYCGHHLMRLQSAWDVEQFGPIIVLPVLLGLLTKLSMFSKHWVWWVERDKMTRNIYHQNHIKTFFNVTRQACLLVKQISPPSFALSSQSSSYPETYVFTTTTQPTLFTATISSSENPRAGLLSCPEI